MRRPAFLLIALFAVVHTAHSQDWLYKIEYVENISPTRYMGDMQVWDIKYGEGEYVYLATEYGLSVWDGMRWSSYEGGPDTYLRTLNYDNNSGIVYSAGNDEFGLWRPDQFGDYVYEQIWENKTSDVTIFWRCYGHDENIYFQALNLLFRLNTKTGKTDRISLDPAGRYMHSLDDGLYLQAGSVLYKIDGMSFEDTGIVVDDRIVFISRKGDDWVLYTESSGIFVWDGIRMRQQNAATNKILSEAMVFSAGGVGDTDTVLLGTVLDGMYIVDGDGNIVTHIGTESGLQHTTVLSLCAGRDGRIWLGLDGGAATVYNSLPDIYYYSPNENIGSVYAASLFRNNLYLGTNKGLYELNQDLELKFIPGSQGQVWSFFNAGNNLIVCHDKGVGMLTNGKLESLPFPDAWGICEYSGDIYFSVDMLGLSIYELKYGRFMMRNKLEGYSESHNKAIADKYGYIWMVDNHGTLVRLKPDKGLTHAESVTKYRIEDSSRKPLLCKVDNEVLFYTDGKAYMYDIASDDIILSNYYSELISLCGGHPMSILQVDDSFYYISGNMIGVVERRKGKLYKRGNIMPRTAEAMIPREFRALWKISDNMIATGVQNGIAFYNMRLIESTEVAPLRLRKLMTLSSNGSEPIAADRNGQYHVPDTKTSLVLYFTGVSPYKTIDYRIDKGDWVTEIVSDALTIPPLSGGNHTIEVRNTGSDDQAAVFTCEIRVKGPWYLNKNYMSLLIVFIIVCFIIINRIYLNKLTQKHKRIQAVQQERMTRQRELHEMEMMRLEVEEKDQQLMSMTMESISRNNMLNEIKNEVIELEKNLNDNPDSRIRKIVRRIDSHRNDKQNWEDFKRHYNAMYDGFFDRLMKAHPDLTSNEMKICAYLKLNLSSKEIAALLNISTSSVEIARHRLRKKINLPKEKSLTGYISSI